MTEAPNSAGGEGVSQETKRLPTYKPGDRIRIELEVTDESGVGRVIAVFALESDPSRRLELNANGEGETTAHPVLTQNVTDNMAPGVYHCAYVELRDTLRNSRVVNRPGIAFRIEGVSGDHEGPNLISWKVLEQPDSPEVRFHVVQPGETLYIIAQQVYGAGNQWHRIYEANRDAIGPSPDFLYPGQKLMIPT
jgi:nucleoid-associated protein YgaU